MKTVFAWQLLFLLAAFSGGASADWENVEASMELAPSQISLPAHQRGHLQIKPCETCPRESLAVVPDTKYYPEPGSAPVSLKAFRRIALMMSQDKYALIAVYFNPDDRSVNRIVINVPDNNH